MDWLIWAGAVVSVLGLAGLVFCIFRVWRAKSSGLGDDALKAVLQKVVPLNNASLLLSILGLMLVVVGIFLG